jgi:hypothetical protein
VVVFFHGFDNCVSNVIGSVDGPCESGGASRAALHLSDQLDAAKINAILVAVELKYDQATGDPGNLANAGEFKAMLDELLGTALPPTLGVTLGADSLDKLVVTTHSGGYWAVADVLSNGGVSPDEVALFDSLYGYESTYSGWVDGDIGAFAQGAVPGRRFVDIWTTGGGTAANSEDFVSGVQAAAAMAGLGADVFYQDATAPDPGPDDFAHSLFFKHSGLSHDGVPMYYFGPIVGASGVAPLP